MGILHYFRFFVFFLVYKEVRILINDVRIGHTALGVAGEATEPSSLDSISVLGERGDGIPFDDLPGARRTPEAGVAGVSGASPTEALTIYPSRSYFATTEGLVKNQGTRQRCNNTNFFLHLVYLFECSTHFLVDQHFICSRKNSLTPSINE